MTHAGITVMTKAPVPGRVKTRLAPMVGFDQAAMIHRALVWATLDRLRQTHLPICVSLGFDPDGSFGRELADRGWAVKSQAPGDLGARMRAVVGRPGRQVLVGTDCVVFEPEWIVAAAASNAPVAVAPSEDGGYWALSVDGGASPPVLDDLFVDVPWSTPEVLPLTLRRCARRGTPVDVLPACYDIDVPSDLSRLFHDIRCPPRVRSLLETLPCLS